MTLAASLMAVRQAWSPDCMLCPRTCKGQPGCISIAQVKHKGGHGKQVWARSAAELCLHDLQEWADFIFPFGAGDDSMDEELDGKDASGIFSQETSV